MSNLDSSLQQLNWLILKGGTSQQDGSSVTDKKKDPNKPPYSYTQLIREAIENSPGQRSTLRDIYKYISSRHEYYKKSINPSWKNSIRHNLSLNKLFQKQDKQLGHKSSFWICNPEYVPRGMKNNGSIPRINPAVKKIYEHAAPSTSKRSTSVTENPAKISLYNQPLSGQSNEDDDDDDDDLADLSLFTSQDLTASFKKVYEQLFPKKPRNISQQNEQIDLIKIALEAAGVNYEDEEEMELMDSDRLANYISHEISSTKTTKNHTNHQPNKRHEMVTRRSEQTRREAHPIQEDSEDEFDWSKIT